MPGVGFYPGGKPDAGNLKEGLDTGDPCELATWEDFYAAYKKQVDHRIDFSAERRLENFGLSNMIAPDPLISSLMDGCIERGPGPDRAGDDL